MDDFDNLQGFLEHISCYGWDNANKGGEVMLMTLHAAKGLEFDVVSTAGKKGHFHHNGHWMKKGHQDWKKNAVWPMSGCGRKTASYFLCISRRVHGLWQSVSVTVSGWCPKNIC